MRTFWKTYVAIAVLAALGAYIYFVERKRPAGGEESKEKVFASLDKEKVKQITIQPLMGEPIRLMRSSDGWRMAEPQPVKAAANEVDSLLSSIEGLEVNETVLESGADFEEYGLKPARLVVGVLSEGDAEPLELELGRKTPGDSELYARVPSSPRVFTVAASLENTFNKKPFDLRDRDVLHVKRDDVKRVEIQGPDGSYALAKDDKGEWSFVSPLKTAAGRWSVDGLVGSLESLRMDSIAAEPANDLKPFGLDKPQRVVRLGLADGRERVLEIGSAAPDDKLYAREASGDLVAVVSKTIGEDLKKGMGELRAKRLLDVSVYDITGFTVEAAGKKQIYVRRTEKDKDGIDVNKWKRSEPDQKDLETNTIQDVLFKIGGVEVAEFIDQPQALTAYGLDRPVLKVSFTMAEPKAPTWLAIGSQDGAYYGRRPKDDAILHLDTAKAEDLIKGFEGL
jgi:hypothetical protein